jgi:hypothetical protein
MRLTKAQKIEITRIAKEKGFSYDQVEKMIRSQYAFIYESLKNLDLPRDLTEEEFKKVAKNYNIPAIGKLYSSYTVYKKLNKL